MSKRILVQKNSYENKLGPSKSSFSCKSNSFSWERLCKKTHFETGHRKLRNGLFLYVSALHHKSNNSKFEMPSTDWNQNHKHVPRVSRGRQRTLGRKLPKLHKPITTNISNQPIRRQSKDKHPTTSAGKVKERRCSMWHSCYTTSWMRMLEAMYNHKNVTEQSNFLFF